MYKATIEEIYSYYSKTFSIKCEAVSPLNYQLTVYDEISGNVVEQCKRVNSAGLDDMFEELKTKYIFDYQAVLTANKHIKLASDSSARIETKDIMEEWGEGSKEKKILKN